MCGQRTIAWEQPLRAPVPYELAVCQECGEVGEPVVINRISLADEYADWPLDRLCVPPLDVLEVRSASGEWWYELTGDLVRLPHTLR